MESSASKKFNCPSCAAPLEVRVTDAATMLCPYCAQSVIIPRELRAAPKPAPAPTPAATPNRPPTTWYAQQRAQGKSNWYLALVFIVVLIAGFAMRESIPRWLANASGNRAIANVISTGPAKVETTFGGAGTGTGLFQEPKLITADDKGFSYVLDSTLRVQRFDTQGKFISFWQIEGKDAPNTDFIPRRMVADRAGNVYIMSPLSIRKYDGTSGKLTTTFKSQNFTEWFYALTLAADGTMIALVEGMPNHSLVWYDATGKITKRLDNPLSDPLGKNPIVNLWDALTVDGVGNLFFLHEEPQQGAYVYKFSRDGKYISRFGGKGDKEGQLDFARQIAVDEQSRVYVLSQKYIQRFDTEGRFLDRFAATVTGNYIHDFALATKNIMYAIGMDSQIFKLTWSNPT